MEVQPGDVSDGEFHVPRVRPTLRGLRCHRGKAQKLRWPAARCAREGVCTHCRVNFNNRACAMAHLEKRAKTCREPLFHFSQHDYLPFSMVLFSEYIIVGVRGFHARG